VACTVTNNFKLKQNKKDVTKWVMFLTENLKIPLSASIAFDRSNSLWAKPKPILQAERENKSVRSRNALSFSVSFQFIVMRLVFTRRYEFATQTLWYDCPSTPKLGEANHNDTKYPISHNLPMRAIIV
jgi:hypothetical protein